MLNYKSVLLKNKKGQVSDAITWVVATLVIIFLVVTSIYIASLMGKSKSVEKEKIVSLDENYVNWIFEKTEFAYDINSNNKVKIDLWVSGSDIDDK